MISVIFQKKFTAPTDTAFVVQVFFKFLLQVTDVINRDSFRELPLRLLGFIVDIVDFVLTSRDHSVPFLRPFWLDMSVSRWSVFHI